MIDTEKIIYLTKKWAVVEQLKRFVKLGAINLEGYAYNCCKECES